MTTIHLYLRNEIAKTNNNELTNEFDTFVNLYFKHQFILENKCINLKKELRIIKIHNNIIIKQKQNIEKTYDTEYNKLLKENEELKNLLKKKSGFNFFNKIKSKIKSKIKRQNTI